MAMSFWITIILGIICVQFSFCEIVEDDAQLNSTDISYNYPNEVYDPPLIEEDIAFYHWFPWKRPKHFTIRTDEEGKECREDSSIDEFPDDLFTQEQRLQGAIVLHFIGVIYFFTISGVVINYYFIPSVQCICQDLKITPDVGAAVFMATATATPELFTNLISTFIADSDMGLGAIIGSLMWNILGVAAVSSLATRKPVKMDWVPISRDCVMFAVNVIVLIGTSWDGYIQWYEALILTLFAIPYYVVMFQSARISRFLKRKFEDEYRCCNRNNYDLEKDVKSKQVNTIYTKDGLTPIDPVSIISNKPPIVEEEKVNEKAVAEAERKALEDREAFVLLKKQRLGLYPQPKDSLARTIFWYYSWPIRVVLFCTIPNPKTIRKLYPLAFILCVIWIGVVTYLIFFMLIVISYTFSIPESVMGITVFAIGGCTPELITGVIMARRGQAGTGLANSFGASSVGIMLCLGAPWLVSSFMKRAHDPDAVIHLETNGVRYTIISMLLIPVALFSIFSIFKYKLRKSSGLCLAITYAAFVTWAIFVELEILFPTGELC